MKVGACIIRFQKDRFIISPYSIVQLNNAEEFTCLSKKDFIEYLESIIEKLKGEV